MDGRISKAAYDSVVNSMYEDYTAEELSGIGQEALTKLMAGLGVTDEAVGDE